jgi:putative ABC transport system permease protein
VSFLALCKIVLSALMRNKMRSMLTALSVAIGVALVVTVVAIGEGARRAVEKAAESMGTNIFYVWPSSTMMGGVRSAAGTQVKLTLDDVRALREELDIVSNASGTVRLGGSQLVNGNRNWNTGVQGVETAFTDVRAWPLDEGQMFTDMDVTQARLVCVLGKRVADELFAIDTDSDDGAVRRAGSTPTRIRENPVGQTIKVRGTPFRVIGVLASKGQSAGGMDQDDVVLVPITTALRRLGAMMSSTAPNAVGSVVVAARNAGAINDAMDAVKELLGRRHKTPIGSEDFTIRNFGEIANAAAAQQKVLAYLLATVAGVSLIVGGIGIMNIMLVSVTERTREIGIRLAVGARSQYIMLQFLLEALTISTFGGLLGIGMAYATTWSIVNFFQWSAEVSPGAVLIASGVSIGIGAFFGLWPARKAALLDPIEALRFE